MMNSVVVPLPSRTHTGSAFILMASGAGAWPSSLIAPVILPAVLGSTAALAAGAPDGAAELLGASCLLLPPHAAAATAMASTGAIRLFSERDDIELSPDAADASVTSEGQTRSEISRGARRVKGPAFALRAPAGEAGSARRVSGGPAALGCATAGLHHLPEHAILHPLRVPPLDGVHRAPVDQHREMQMVAAGEPGHAAAADRLSLLDAIPGLDVHRREVAIKRLDAEAMVDDDAVAVDAEVVRVHHDAALGRGDRNIGRHRQVEPEVHLPVDFLPLVEVGPVVGELRFHL